MRGFDPTVLQSRTASYPNVEGLTKGTVFLDQFDRATINPTGGYALYSTAAIGAGSVSILNNANLYHLTEAVINSYARSIMTELTIGRVAIYDSRSVVEHDISVRLNTSVASVEMFAGYVDQSVTLTALPGTQKYFGIYFDASVSGNLQLASGNGAAQSLTDTGVAPLAASTYLLNILWSGTNTVTLKMYDNADPTTVLATKDVTDIGSVAVCRLTNIVNPEAAAVKSLLIGEHRIQIR